MRSIASKSNRDFNRTVGCLCVLVCTLGALPLPLPAQQTSPKPITLAVIVDAMEAREKRAATVSLRWIESDRYSAGALQPKPGTWTFPCEMLLKRSSMRYVSKTFSQVDGMIDYVSSYDGNESRHLMGGKRPRGTIFSEKADTNVHLFTLTPFMLYFRPLAEPFATLKRKELKLLDGRKTIDGHKCVTIDDGHLRVDLDCERDFVPVAYQSYLKNGVRYLDGSLEYYRYDKHDGLSWVPKAFQVASKRMGVTARGDRVQAEIGVPLKDSDFSLIFEPGTIVWDERTREEYLLRTDGSKEPIQKPRRRRPPAK
jgi:hypothetical protein